MQRNLDPQAENIRNHIDLQLSALHTLVPEFQVPTLEPTAYSSWTDQIVQRFNLVQQRMTLERRTQATATFNRFLEEFKKTLELFAGIVAARDTLNVQAKTGDLATKKAQLQGLEIDLKIATLIDQLEEIKGRQRKRNEPVVPVPQQPSSPKTKDHDREDLPAWIRDHFKRIHEMAKVEEVREALKTIYPELTEEIDDVADSLVGKLKQGRR